MDINDRIIQLRKSKNISTNKLANKAGISQSYLREIELGRKNPTVEILSYICDALNISMEVFFSENSSPIHPSLITAIQQLDEDEQIKLAELINIMKSHN